MVSDTNYAEIKVHHMDLDTSILTCAGTLDDWALQFLKDNLEPAALFSTFVVLDLRKVVFIEATVLQAIVMSAKHIMAKNGELMVKVTDRTHPEEVLRRTGLNQFLHVQTYPSPSVSLN